MIDREDKGRIWLYENKYAKTDKHPIKTGPGEISRIVLKQLAELMKDSGEDVVKVQCAAWERISKQGNPYTFITIEPGDGKSRTPQSAEEIPF